MVREGGLEPPRSFPHKVLSLARLPFRHSRDRGSKSFNWVRHLIQAARARCERLERRERRVHNSARDVRRDTAPLRPRAEPDYR